MKLTLHFIIKTTVQGEKCDTTIFECSTSADEVKKKLEYTYNLLKEYNADNNIPVEIKKEKDSFTVVSADKASMQHYVIQKRDIVTDK